MTKLERAKARFQWLRLNLTQEWQRLKRRMLCNHTHKFSYYLNGARWETVNRSGQHDGLKLEGCYLCGATWVRDWKA